MMLMTKRRTQSALNLLGLILNNKTIVSVNFLTIIVEGMANSNDKSPQVHFSIRFCGIHFLFFSFAPMWDEEAQWCRSIFRLTRFFSSTFFWLTNIMHVFTQWNTDNNNGLTVSVVGDINYQKIIFSFSYYFFIASCRFFCVSFTSSSFYFVSTKLNFYNLLLLCVSFGHFCSMSFVLHPFAIFWSNKFQFSMGRNMWQKIIITQIQRIDTLWV